jgi:type I restriction enzyme R subunit
VKGHGGAQLADLVSLVRHALIPEFTLVPYAEEVRARYGAWLVKRDAIDSFSTEQRQWLDRMADHIATSLELRPEDFEDGWFGQNGSLGRANAVFGDGFRRLLAELNDRLAA